MLVITKWSHSFGTRADLYFLNHRMDRYFGIQINQV